MRSVCNVMSGTAAERALHFANVNRLMGALIGTLVLSVGGVCLSHELKSPNHVRTFSPLTKRGGLKGGASAEVENKTRSTASTHRQDRVMRPERRKRSRYIIQEEHPSATRSDVSYTGSVMFPNFLEFRGVSNFLEFREIRIEFLL